MRKLVIVMSVLFLQGCALGYHAVNGTLTDVFPNLAAKSNAPTDAATATPVPASTAAISPASHTATSPHSVVLRKFGDGTGYQPAINVDIPNDVCDRNAFVDGVKDNFVANWNQFVKAQISLFQGQLVKRPLDKSASKNLALYRSRLIGTKGYAPAKAKYAAARKTNGADVCPSSSYVRGQDVGIDIVARERKSLVGQEV